MQALFRSSARFHSINHACFFDSCLLNVVSTSSVGPDRDDIMGNCFSSKSDGGQPYSVCFVLGGPGSGKGTQYVTIGQTQPRSLAVSPSRRPARSSPSLSPLALWHQVRQARGRVWGPASVCRRPPSGAYQVGDCRWQYGGRDDQERADCAERDHRRAAPEGHERERQGASSVTSVSLALSQKFALSRSSALALSRSRSLWQSVFLIDGFPRNDENRQRFESQTGMMPKMVLFFDCSEDVMTARYVGRGAIDARCCCPRQSVFKPLTHSLLVLDSLG